MRAMYLLVILGFVFVIGHEDLHVHGPSGPVEVQLGGSVILSCFIEGPLPLEDLQVEWRKTASDSVISFFQQGESRADRDVFASKGEDVVLNCSVDSHVPTSEIEEVAWKRKDGDSLVLLYQDREIFSDSSHEHYQGRVDLFSSEIPKGNFSLKLTDVQMEDKGEFKCEVHTRNMSGRTTVVLQGVGFSALHIVMLVLCSVTLFLTLGFCVPVFNLLRKKDANKAGMKRQLLLMLCPNICLFVTFCLWSPEGLVSEVITCSIVSIMRPVLLLKTSPHLSKLPDRVQKMVKAFAFPIYHVTIAIAACSVFFKNFARVQALTGNIVTVMFVVGLLAAFGSLLLAVYDFQIYLTICLELFNVEVLGIILSNTTTDFNYIFNIPYIITALMMGMMMTLVIQRHLFREKPFTHVYIVLPSVGVTILSFCTIYVYFMLAITAKDFVEGWMLLFEGVLYIVVWVAVIYLLRRYQGQRQRYSCQRRNIGYLCCAVIVSFFIPAYCALSFYYLANIVNDKDRAGYFALMTLVNVLAALCLFKHPKHLPGFLHTVIYMFGAVGLCTVNALVLATELILKAGKGARTIGDLRVIVLPLEIVYLFAWLALQIYDSWMRFRQRAEPEDERRTRPEIVPELEVLSDRNPD